MYSGGRLRRRALFRTNHDANLRTWRSRIDAIPYGPKKAGSHFFLPVLLAVLFKANPSKPSKHAGSRPLFDSSRESHRLFGSIPARLQSLNERHQRAVHLFMDLIEAFFHSFKGCPALPLRFAGADDGLELVVAGHGPVMRRAAL